jgi:carboxymethylenebutenolidase
MAPETTDGICGEECFQPDRREFGAMLLGTGVALAAGGAAAAELKETDVTITTPDGSCDAVFVHPATGTHPGVLIWPDVMGLRPAFRDMAKRLAAEGYAVLVPNPFYRTAKAPAPGPDFNFQRDRDKLPPLVGPLTAPGAAERDATTFIAWLDKQNAVNKKAKMGTTGYCMGGPLTMRTAATVPDRIGAGGSFHGGGLVTDKPESPHRMVPKMKARYLIAIAENDDQKEPNTKDELKAAFAAAKLPAEIEVYAGAMHGWCVPGSQVYNHEQAERAWGRLLALFKTTLV